MCPERRTRGREAARCAQRSAYAVSYDTRPAHARWAGAPSSGAAPAPQSLSAHPRARPPVARTRPPVAPEPSSSRVLSCVRLIDRAAAEAQLRQAKLEHEAERARASDDAKRQQQRIHELSSQVALATQHSWLQQPC